MFAYVNLIPEAREDFLCIRSCRGSNKGDSVVTLFHISDMENHNSYLQYFFFLSGPQCSRFKLPHF